MLSLKDPIQQWLLGFCVENWGLVIGPVTLSGSQTSSWWLVSSVTCVDVGTGLNKQTRFALLRLLVWIVVLVFYARVFSIFDHFMYGICVKYYGIYALVELKSK